jgi:hypothetical protein
LTDVSILSISAHCSVLQELYLHECARLTDASIISISENCHGLTRISVGGILITDASLIAIAKNCTRLLYLKTYLNGYEYQIAYASNDKLLASLLSIYPSLPI